MQRFLERVKEEQEDVLKADLIEIYKSLQPAELVKSAIDNIREDVEVGEKASGLVGSLGLNYLVGRLMGKNNSPKGYIKSLIVQQIVTYLYRKNEKSINQFIGGMTRKALKKIHLIDEDDPFAEEEEQHKQDDLEEQEDAELKAAKDEDQTEEQHK